MSTRLNHQEARTYTSTCDPRTVRAASKYHVTAAFIKGDIKTAVLYLDDGCNDDGVDVIKRQLIVIVELFSQLHDGLVVG